MSEIKVNTVSEATVDNGVTIDGVLLKDGEVNVDTVDELTGSAGVTVGGVKHRLGQHELTVQTLTYGTTIAVDASSGPICKITVTDAVGFTINNPTNLVAGTKLLFDILNSSGGAMGAITWDTLFLLAGAFTNPADTTRRTIEFYYDGTNLVEVGRAAADI